MDKYYVNQLEFVAVESIFCAKAFALRRKYFCRASEFDDVMIELLVLHGATNGLQTFKEKLASDIS